MGRRPKPRRHAGQKVEQHPLYEEIFELARNRFSAESIVRLLQHQYRAEIESGEMLPLPTARSIQRWRVDRMPEKDLLPARTLQKKLESLDEKVDLIQRTQLLYGEAEDRVAKFLAMQEKLDLPLPSVDEAIKTLLAIGRQLWQLGQDVGMYPSQATPALALGVRGADGSAAFAILQVGDGPSRMIDLRNPDLSELSQQELDALRQLPAGQEHGPGEDQREAEASS